MWNYLVTVWRWLGRYWLWSTVACFALLTIYTSSPLFGQSPTPTPDIRTVPDLIRVATATNTPFPTATPVAPAIPQAPAVVVTDTPSSNHPKNQDNADDAGDDPANEPNRASGGVTTSGDAATKEPSVADTQTFTQTNNLPTGRVSVAVLNMRKSPGANSAIVDTLFRNDIVQIQARSADGAWWLVCCGADTKQAGWVSASLIQPNFALAQANTLLPIGAGVALAPTQITTVTTGAALPTPLPVLHSGIVTASKAVTLALQMRPSPAFVWQGQRVQLQFAISNRGQTPAVNVRLRDDLGPALAYSAATISQNGRFQQQAKAQGGSILTLTWPQLAAGATVTATVTLRIATGLPNGSLIDNLAVAAADNASDVSAGITLAMPPTVLPLFK